MVDRLVELHDRRRDLKSQADDVAAQELALKLDLETFAQQKGYEGIMKRLQKTRVTLGKRKI